jgi:hypothetical protein
MDRDPFSRRPSALATRRGTASVRRAATRTEDEGNATKSANYQGTQRRYPIDPSHRSPAFHSDWVRARDRYRSGYLIVSDEANRVTSVTCLLTACWRRSGARVTYADDPKLVKITPAAL